MLRMLIAGYVIGPLVTVAVGRGAPNLAYRWSCCLGLDGPAPDHSTFSKNLHGRFHDDDVLRQLLEAKVAA